METLKNIFREAIEAGEFVVTCETIPGRGAVEVSQEKGLARNLGNGQGSCNLYH